MTTAARPTGLNRIRTYLRLFRNEKTDPAPFYELTAAEAAEDLDRHYGPLAGQTIVDLGCGPGWYTRALRDRGATVIPVDRSEEELHLGGDPPEDYVLADAGDLPLQDGSVDAVLCSNLLEHTPDAEPVFREIERVLKPGGWAYVSWTPWWSPWGGHDMIPYHLLGTRLGPRAYERRHGPPRKNGLGDGLWVRHVGPTLKLAKARPKLEIERVEARYWPRLSAVTRVPVLRELLTGNCVIRIRKATGPSAAAPGSAP